MVSNASDDLPEPLTPVTTVIALWGTSRLIFFRLWTRAPRMEIVSWLVFTGMSSLVATGKLRQRVPRALSKLQIIRRARSQGKPSFLRLFDQADLPDAALHRQTNRRRRLAVGFVGIFVVIVAQSVSVHRANAARSVNHHANFSGQPYGHLANPALQIGDQIILAIAREIQISLTSAHLHFQSCDRHVAKVQLAAARAHFNFQLQRYVVAEAQIPLIVFGAKVGAALILGNAQVANAVCDVVIDPRRLVGFAIVEIRIKQMTGAAADIQLSAARFHRYIHRLGALPIHRPSLVL